MIIPVYKPAGLTSQAVVARVKGMFRASGRTVKAGHSGTLDPMCTGVLPVLTGRYTKLADFLPSDKRYTARLLLGTETDTEDVTGTVLAERPVSVSLSDVEAAAGDFVGKLLQVPPMYSALKHNGQRLYDLARSGVTVERAPREITVYSLTVSPAENEKTFFLDVACSSGTYIRTLCADLGRKLGTGGCMASLERTESNGFSLGDCVRLEDLAEAVAQGSEDTVSFGCEETFRFLPERRLEAPAVTYYRNGGEISLARTSGTGENGLVRVYTGSGLFLGLGKTENGKIRSAWLAEGEANS